MVRFLPGILFHPRTTFERLRRTDFSLIGIILGYLAPLALIAPIAAYFGTTRIGWSVANGIPVTLTPSSAGQISVAYFFAILVASLTVGVFIYWMSETYGRKQEVRTCVALAVLSATPLYLAGILQGYPVVLMNYLVGLPLLAYSIYLLFTGIEVLLGVEKDRAFLFGASILAVGLVALVGLLVATVILWGVGIGPDFRALG